MTNLIEKSEKPNFKVKLMHIINPKNVKRWSWIVVRSILVLGICYTIFFPLFVKITMSFMAERDLIDSTIKYIPKNFTLNNYIMALQGLDYFNSLLKTLFLSIITMILQVFSCGFAAYAFARFQFPLKKMWFFFVILILVVPPQTIMTPLYMQFRYFNPLGIAGLFTEEASVNLIGTFWPMFLLSATCNGFKNGLFIYIFRQHFRGLPKALEEAAFIDGSGHFQTYFKIIIPSSLPIITTIGLFSFAWQWTDNFYSNLFFGNTKVLSTSLGSLAQNLWRIYGTDGMGELNFISPGFQSIVNSSGTILILIPIFLLYLFCQKAFVEGIERSGIVG